MIVQPAAADECTSLHDRTLGELVHPPWLVEGRLRDDVWLIRTLDPTLVRKSSRRIRFDTVVASGNARLTDPDLEHDRITAKLLCYYCLSPAPAGGVTSSVGVAAQIVLAYYSFVRWRLTHGIPRNSDLTPHWIDLFIATLRRRGARGLLPEGLMQTYLDGLRSRGERLPTYTTRGIVCLQRKAVAAELGLDTLALLHSEDKQALFEALDQDGIVIKRALEDGVGETWKGRKRASGDDSTAAPFAHLLHALHLLFEFRHRLAHDAITFPPLDGRSVYGLAQSLSTHQPNRTKTIPPLQACHLIEHALIWVLRYSDEIRAMYDLVCETIPPDAASTQKRAASRRIQFGLGYGPQQALEATGPWPVRDAHRRKYGEIAKGRPLFAAVVAELLPAACMIVIAAFSARRHQEIESLRAGCMSRDGADAWLECWISKTLRSVDKIPVPDVVAKAVETLEWLSRAGRTRTGTDWLLRIDRPLELGATGNDRRNLRRFAKHVRVPPLADGSKWWFAPHQFRRFFGIVYYHRYRFPHLVALSNFYRHFDPDMTRRYISETASGNFLWASEEQRIRRSEEERKARFRASDRLQDFQEEALNFRLDRYSAIASGHERVSGFGGELLKKDLEKLQQEAMAVLEIGPGGDGTGPTLDQLLMNFAKDRRLEPNPLGHSYCKCTSDQVDLKSAACLHQNADEQTQIMRGAPDPRFAGDLTCSGCPHNVQLPENEAYWRQMIQHEGRQKNCAPGTLLAELAARRQDAASAHCERCFE